MAFGGKEWTLKDFEDEEKRLRRELSIIGLRRELSTLKSVAKRLKRTT